MKKSFVQRVDFHASLRAVQVEIQAAPSEIRAVPSNDQTEVQERAPKDSELDPTSKDNAHQIASLLGDISQQLDELKQARDQNLRELQVLAIEIAVAVSAHVIKEKVDADEFNLEHLVSAAVQKLVPTDLITVSIHPLDRANLEKIPGDALEGVRQRVELIEDAEIPRGSCHVEGNAQGLISSLETRLDHIRETLLQGIDYARTERRKIGDVAGPLRRFPDRRKPA